MRSPFVILRTAARVLNSSGMIGHFPHNEMAYKNCELKISLGQSLREFLSLWLLDFSLEARPLYSCRSWKFHKDSHQKFNCQNSNFKWSKVAFSSVSELKQFIIWKFISSRHGRRKPWGCVPQLVNKGGRPSATWDTPQRIMGNLICIGYFVFSPYCQCKHM